MNFLKRPFSKRPYFFRSRPPKLHLTRGSLPNCPPKMPPPIGGKRPNCPKTAPKFPQNRPPPNRGKSAKIASQIAVRPTNPARAHSHTRGFPLCRELELICCCVALRQRKEMGGWAPARSTSHSMQLPRARCWPCTWSKQAQ